MVAALLQSFGLNAMATLWHLPLAGSCPAAIIRPQHRSNPVEFTSSSLVSHRCGLSATYVGWAGPSVSSVGTRQVEPLGWVGHLVVCRSHYDDYEWVTLLASASELLHGRAVSCTKQVWYSEHGR